MPGVYAALLERERQRTNDGDPRRVFSDSDGDFTMAPTHLFHASSTGESVELPWWRLGGHTVPNERIRQLKRADRSITGWRVHADDAVLPIRRNVV